MSDQHDGVPRRRFVAGALAGGGAVASAGTEISTAAEVLSAP
jgi:hypothetical protein